MIINWFIRLQIELVFFRSVVCFTIVAMHRFDDDSDRNGMKQYEQIIQYNAVIPKIFFNRTLIYVEIYNTFVNIFFSH